MITKPFFSEVDPLNQSRKYIESIFMNIIYTNSSRLLLVNVIYTVTINNSSQTFQVEIIFLGLLYRLRQHQTCKQAINVKRQSWSHYRSTNFPEDLFIRGYLKEQKKAILTLLQLQDQLFVSFFRCSSNDIFFNLTHRINTARIRPKPPTGHHLASGIASKYAK